MQQPSSPPFAEKLRQAREEAALSQAELAERLGVSIRLITYYEAGSKVPHLARLPAIAAAVSKPVQWFFEEVKGRAYAKSSLLRDTVAVPLFERVPAGPPSEFVPEAVGWVGLPARWVRGSETYCLRVRGNSMEPTIMDGDLVAVRRQPQAENGAIVLARLAEDGGLDSFTLKKLVKRGSTVTLKSLNPAYPEIRGDKILVEGIVVGLQRDLGT